MGSNKPRLSELIMDACHCDHAPLRMKNTAAEPVELLACAWWKGTRPTQGLHTL
jgi:hypothetical protein